MEAKFNQDKELVFKLKYGDEAAFKLLFGKYERKLFVFSRKILLSSEEAEEVVQEVFLKIWKNKRLLDENLSFSSFLFTIAKNLIYNQLSKKVSETTYKKYSQYVSPKLGNSTEEIFYFNELKKEIKVNVSCMPEKRRNVFLMSRFEGYSNKEIAEKLELSMSTVENHINKALKGLKHHLKARGANIT